MNILPKKRWHVRTKANIAKVRKDEACAAEEEKKKLLRKQIAEQEAKKALLRKKAREEYYKTNLNYSDLSPELQHQKQVVITTNETSSNHVNLFFELEKNEIVSNKPNEEHEKEKKLEREKYEKQIGYLTYLGQETNELTGNVSWYNKTRKEIYNETEEVSKKQKIFEDPLTEIRKYVKHDELEKSSISNKSENQNSIEKYFIEHRNIVQNERKKHKKLKKEKFTKKKKKLEKKKFSKPHDCKKEVILKKTSSIDIEKLRAERIKREKEEQKRAQEVFAQLNGLAGRKNLSPEPVQRYNSQFNPHLAKQNY